MIRLIRESLHWKSSQLQLKKFYRKNVTAKVIIFFFNQCHYKSKQEFRSKKKWSFSLKWWEEWREFNEIFPLHSLNILFSFYLQTTYTDKGPKVSGIFSWFLKRMFDIQSSRSEMFLHFERKWLNKKTKILFLFLSFAAKWWKIHCLRSSNILCGQC